MYTAVAVNAVMPSYAVMQSQCPSAHVYKYIQGVLTALKACCHDGYRSIHAGVTKSGVKKWENGLTRVSAADCSDDDKCRTNAGTASTEYKSAVYGLVGQVNLFFLTSPKSLYILLGQGCSSKNTVLD